MRISAPRYIIIPNTMAKYKQKKVAFDLFYAIKNNLLKTIFYFARNA